MGDGRGLGGEGSGLGGEGPGLGGVEGEEQGLRVGEVRSSGEVDGGGGGARLGGLGEVREMLARIAAPGLGEMVVAPSAECDFCMPWLPSAAQCFCPGLSSPSWPAVPVRE